MSVEVKRLSVLMLLCCLLVVCGGDESPTRSTPTTTTTSIAPRASITVSVVPDPVEAVPSGDPDFPWFALFEVRIVETAGLGLNINFINVVVAGLSPLNFGASEIVDLAGTNHVDPKDTLDVPLGFIYTSPSGSFNAVLVVNATDDRGNSLIENLPLVIQPAASLRLPGEGGLAWRKL